MARELVMRVSYCNNSVKSYIFDCAYWCHAFCTKVDCYIFDTTIALFVLFCLFFFLCTKVLNWRKWTLWFVVAQISQLLF